jgi:hypothetical protein
MRRRLRLAGAALGLVGLGLGLGVWRYRLAHPPLPPPPTAAELDRLVARRDALQARIRELIVAAGETSLAQAPRGGIMIGIPTVLTQSIAEQLVSGFFNEMTLTLENVKARKAGEVRVKMLLGKKRIGSYDLEVNIAEIQGVLRPGKPQFGFSAGRFTFVMPVRLAEGHGRAQLHFKWDSKGVAANLVCGDADLVKEVTGSVVPADYTLRGAFDIATQGEEVTLRPDFADLAVRIAVSPSEQAWGVVDEVIQDQRAGCEMALGKIDLKEKLAAIVGRGFNVKVPKKLLRDIRLPAGLRQSLEIQGLRLAVQVKPTAVLVSPERLWYGADLTLEKPRTP